MLRCSEFVDRATAVEEGVAPVSMRVPFHLHLSLPDIESPASPNAQPPAPPGGVHGR